MAPYWHRKLVSVIMDKKIYLPKSHIKTVLLWIQATSLSGTNNSSQLAVMLEQACKMWWKREIFVLTVDHSNNSLYNLESNRTTQGIVPVWMVWKRCNRLPPMSCNAENRTFMTWWFKRGQDTLPDFQNLFH